MAKEHQHQWACFQTKGSLGEITTKTPLNPDQVKLVQEDISQAEVVCPGGMLACADCNIPMIGQQTKNTIDFSSLTQRLMQFKEPGSENNS